MKISEVTVYKLEATNKELDISIYDRGEGEAPYYRVGTYWYTTNDKRIYPLDVYDHAPTYNTLSEILERNFQDMMPFKGQLELF